MKLEPSAHMYPSDLERFQTEETFSQAFSVEVGRPGETTVPLYDIPSGYVLVPVEPTEAMILAMVKAVYGPATFKVTPATVEMENMRDAYKAMIEGEQ